MATVRYCIHTCEHYILFNAAERERGGEGGDYRTILVRLFHVIVTFRSRSRHARASLSKKTYPVYLFIDIFTNREYYSTTVTGNL